VAAASSINSQLTSSNMSFGSARNKSVTSSMRRSKSKNVVVLAQGGQGAGNGSVSARASLNLSFSLEGRRPPLPGVGTQHNHHHHHHTHYTPNASLSVFERLASTVNKISIQPKAK
jgi:hypothetical protein